MAVSPVRCHIIVAFDVGGRSQRGPNCPLSPPPQPSWCCLQKAFVFGKAPIFSLIYPFFFAQPYVPPPFCRWSSSIYAIPSFFIDGLCPSPLPKSTTTQSISFPLCTVLPPTRSTFILCPHLFCVLNPPDTLNKIYILAFPR